MVYDHTPYGGDMFNINYSSEVPLYQQIVEQTKEMLAADLLKDGDKFPSVREISKSLSINQTTVSKAFKELDRLGIIETKPGIGTFIKIDEVKIKNSKEEFILKLEDEFKQAIFLGFDLKEISEIYEKVERSLYEDKGK